MEAILVVDNDPDAREVAAACLRDHGMKPLFASNGREAMDVVARQRPDAVLTDMHMPEMDGLELVERMRREHPDVPVVLMTSRTNARSAIEALRAGALSYCPKRELKGSLCDAMRTVMVAVEARRRHEAAPDDSTGDTHFVIGYDFDAVTALVSHLQERLEKLDFCDEIGLFRIGTAIGEALTNAIDHGNLELDSELREQDTVLYAKKRQERCLEQPWRDRRVHVIERVAPDAVTYIVRDEGRGFDVTAVPDPRDPANLLKVSGRGLMLIRTFMDEVSFNDDGNEITMVKLCESQAREDVPAARRD